MSGEAIISIKPRFAEAILSGLKTVELRRRIPTMHPKTRLWIYATRPVGAVVGSATLDRVVKGDPDRIWMDYGSHAGVSHDHFLEYYEGANEAVCLFLTEVARRSPVSIDQLKCIQAGFHPPQVMKKITRCEAASISVAGPIFTS